MFEQKHPDSKPPGASSPDCGLGFSPAVAKHLALQLALVGV